MVGVEGKKKGEKEVDLRRPAVATTLTQKNFSHIENRFAIQRDSRALNRITPCSLFPEGPWRRPFDDRGKMAAREEETQLQRERVEGDS